jgi:hypothetical protein
VNDAFTCEYLARACQRAEPSGEVERSPAVSTLDGDRLTDVEPDADAERRCGVFGAFAREACLEVDSRTDRAARRLKDRQGLVAAKLEELATRQRDLLANDPGELPREPRRRDVAVFLRKARVATYVRDQERPYLGRFGTGVDGSVYDRSRVRSIDGGLSKPNRRGPGVCARARRSCAVP